MTTTPVIWSLLLANEYNIHTHNIVWPITLHKTICFHQERLDWTSKILGLWSNIMILLLKYPLALE